MIALMYDGLELGKFYKDGNDVLRLKLNDGVQASWLPYIFEIGLESDMNKIIGIWIKERVFPKNRLGNRRMLKQIGLKRYNIKRIAKVTRCSVVTDPYWIVYDNEDTYTKNSIRGRLGLKKFPYNSLGLLNEEDYTWRI